jgi:hypothetical protein
MPDVSEHRHESTDGIMVVCRACKSSIAKFTTVGLENGSFGVVCPHCNTLGFVYLYNIAHPDEFDGKIETSDW